MRSERQRSVRVEAVSFVGSVERSDTHQLGMRAMMDIASLHPSYTLA